MLLHIPVDRLAPAVSLEGDLGIDSLLHMTMVMGLERRFGVELPDRDAAPLKSVADVIEVVRTRLAGRSSAGRVPAVAPHDPLGSADTPKKVEKGWNASRLDHVDPAQAPSSEQSLKEIETIPAPAATEPAAAP